ncbi:MAG: NTP transferase domain-containing protein [Pseudomonadota bacterium]
MAESIAAVVVAAGFSQHGGCRQSSPPLGAAPLLGRAVDLLRRAGLTRIVVVVGQGAPELGPSLNSLGGKPVVNHGHDQGWLSSARRGLGSLGSDIQAAFVLPATRLLPRPATLVSVAQVWRAGQAAVAQPCFLGCRGYPLLLNAGLLSALAAWRGQGGLGEFLAEQAGPALEVEVPDQGVLPGREHPQKYKDPRAGWRRGQVPTPQEVQALLGPVLGVAPAVRSHGRAVAVVALALGRALTRAGQILDLELLETAALLHDLAKGQPSHARAGGQTLRRWGWEPVARLVEVHMDLAPLERGPLSEAEVLYLADKLVQGEKLTKPQARFQAKLARYVHDPVASEAIRRRWLNALTIQDRIEQACGRSLELMLAGLVENGFPCQPAAISVPTGPRGGGIPRKPGSRVVTARAGCG